MLEAGWKPSAPSQTSGPIQVLPSPAVPDPLQTHRNWKPLVFPAVCDRSQKPCAFPNRVWVCSVARLRIQETNTEAVEDVLSCWCLKYQRWLQISCQCPTLLVIFWRTCSRTRVNVVMKVEERGDYREDISLMLVFIKNHFLAVQFGLDKIFWLHWVCFRFHLKKYWLLLGSKCLPFVQN